MDEVGIDFDLWVDAARDVLPHSLASMWLLWLMLTLLVGGWLIVMVSVGVYRRYLFYRSGLKDIDRMSGMEFERYLCFLFRRLGFDVERTADRGDYGADLIARKRGKRIVIQAKRYKRKVGVAAIQEAAAARGYYSCDVAMVITNSLFTAQAQKLAARNRIDLWNRHRLARAMASAGGTKAVLKPLPVREPVAVQAVFAERNNAQDVEDADCCAVCGERVSAKVREYCLARQVRFGGRVLCYRHQRGQT